MSPLVPASPSVARRDRGLLSDPGLTSDHALLLTKRRAVDFGLVATCLCRPF